MLTLIQSIFEIQIMLQSVSRLTAIVLPNGYYYYYYYIIAVLKYGPDTTPSNTPPHTLVNTWLLTWPSELQRRSQDSLRHILLRESHSLPIITPGLKTASEIWGKAQPDCLSLTQPQWEERTLLLLSHSFPLLGRQPLLSLATRKPNESERKS